MVGQPTRTGNSNSTQNAESKLIPIHEIRGNQFMKARTLMLPVIIINAHTFRMPSATGGAREHTVEFDSSESPTACSCTCEAYAMRTACWAMARALDVMTVLGVHQIYVGRLGLGTLNACQLDEAERPALKATLSEGGDMCMLTAPETGMVYNVQ
jgi:hypothetical protein